MWNGGRFLVPPEIEYLGTYLFEYLGTYLFDSFFCAKMSQKDTSPGTQKDTSPSTHPVPCLYVFEGQRSGMAAVIDFKMVNNVKNIHKGTKMETKCYLHKTLFSLSFLL